MTAIDYEVEYNNRVRVPENPAIIAGWVRDAAAYREAHPPRVLRYGDGVRHTIDVFSGDDADTATVMFIHGGYWQALDASFFSHCAAGLNAHGISVALPNYDLCPAVSVADIIDQMRAACRALATFNKRLVVSGNSAGGHLAACLLATDWHAIDQSLPDDFMRAGYAISGLFDLRPLVPTSINTSLRMDAASAHDVSPLFWTPPAGSTFDAAVGGDESGEYFRQSRTLVAEWGAAGVITRVGTVPGANHFTAIAPLADARSEMVLRLKEMAHISN